MRTTLLKKLNLKSLLQKALPAPRYTLSQRIKISISFFIFLLIFPLSSLGAVSSNTIKIHPIDSPLYDAIQYLYILEGKSLPSTAGPYSNDELVLMFNSINKKELDAKTLPTYQYIENELTKELSPFSIHAKVSLEAYLHTNPEDFTTNADWNYNYEARKPFLSIPLEISLHNFFYAHMEVVFGNPKYLEGIGPTKGRSPLYGIYPFTTNLLHFWRSEETPLDGTMPHLGFVAVGGTGWNLVVGRDKISWGPGTTGNLVLSDHVQYHNMARFTAYTNTFKYTLLTSFFPHPDEIHAPPPYTQARELMGLKMFMAYRLEWRLFKEKLGLAVTEGIMYQSKEGILDLRVFNPFIIYHNYYIRSMSNSLLALELNYTPISALNIYGQIAIDEFESSKEKSGTNVHPNAMGYMVGATYVLPYKQGLFYGNIEGVYTDPYLYLRSVHGHKSQSTEPEDTLNFVVALRRWALKSVVYDQYFMGYPYGGDAIIGNLSFGYKEYGSWAVTGNLFYMVHGEKEMNSLWLLDTNESTPTEVGTHYIDIGVTSSVYLFERMQLYGGLNWLANFKEGVALHDVQLSMGISYTL